MLIPIHENLDTYPLCGKKGKGERGKGKALKIALAFAYANYVYQP